MNIPELLQQMIAEQEDVFKRPVLHLRFLLRNGQEFVPRKRIGRRGSPKACFENAYRFVMSHGEAAYVEGYVFMKDIGLPIPHAWVTITGDDAMDPTLNAHDHGYFGVKFTREQVEKYTTMSGYHRGLLGPAVNTGLYADMDPKLIRWIRTQAACGRAWTD